jgi:hypothetical protein
VLAAAVIVGSSAHAQIDAVSWSAGDITNVRQRPIRPAETADWGQAVSTTTVNAFGAAASNTDVEFDERRSQTITVVNTHATQLLCFRLVKRTSSSQTCEASAAAVAAGDMTCTGSGNADGTPIPPNYGSVTVTTTGEDCMHLEASGASTGAVAFRYSREAQ